MPEVTHTSWFQRLGKSVVGMLLGFALFLGSFVVLFVNEGTIDKSKVAAAAVEVDADQPAPADAQGLVAIGGTAVADKPIGDGLFLKPGRYLSISRNAEVFAWVEDKKTETKKDAIGGGETTITTYFYKKQWVSQAQSETSFEGYQREDYNNHQRSAGELISNAKALRRTVADADVRVPAVKMGRYVINTAGLELPALESVADLAAAADKARVAAVRGASFNAQYLYLRKVPGAAEDRIGDERVSYAVVKSDFKGTAFGRLKGANLESFAVEEALKNSTSLYRLFAGDKQTAVQTLHSEYVLWTWIVRILGFVMMWVGLMLIFGPISTFLDLVSIIGSISRFLVNGILFVIALVLSGVTILISMVAHSVIALVITLAVVIGLVIFIVLMVKRKKKSSAAGQTTV